MVFPMVLNNQSQVQMDEEEQSRGYGSLPEHESLSMTQGEHRNAQGVLGEN